MPFKSEAQRKWMYANEPEMAERWQKHTKDKDLPARKRKRAGTGLGGSDPDTDRKR